MRKNNSAIYAVVFILFICAAGALCYAGFTRDSVYFLTVAEARAMPPEELKSARLFGLVSSPDRKKGEGELAFNLVDADKAGAVIPVVFRGVVPDAFKPGAEVIIEGSMKNDGGFVAKTLMTKCPSKYQKENRKI